MRYLKICLLVFLVILSCSKEKMYVNLRPTADFTYTDFIDHFQLLGNSSDINGDIFTYEWVSMSDTVKIINPNSRNAYIYLPELKDTAQVKIKLFVSNGILSDSIEKNITLPKSTLERIYGLGENLSYEHSNNVNYDWYYDQYNTSPDPFNINCGPTAVTMAAKWANENFNRTATDVSNNFMESHYWNSHDITCFFDQYSINYYIINLNQIDSIQRQINLGNIAILEVFMPRIRKEENVKWHINKFNNLNGYHYIIVKGYKIVDNIVYYEVYDPDSFGMCYDNGTLKGIDRYYRGDDLNGAVLVSWPYAIIVSKSPSKGLNYGVDVNKIMHKTRL
jgi:hypothetical protein